jgi:hypothetical protein
MFWVIGICKEYEGCGSVKVKECDKMNDSVMLMWTMIAAVCTAASTLVYTIATIIICRANAKSAAAAAEQSLAMQIQTQELIRQYHDSTRARIAIRFGYDNAIGKYLILKNVGIHDADNVRVAINKEFLDELAADFKENNVRTLVDSVIHIASGQEFPVFVNFASAIERMKYPIARVHVSYCDGLEVYNEDAVIDFSQYGFLSTCRSTRTVNGQRIEEDVVLKG